MGIASMMRTMGMGSSMLDACNGSHGPKAVAVAWQSPSKVVPLAPAAGKPARTRLAWQSVCVGPLVSEGETESSV